MFFTNRSQVGLTLSRSLVGLSTRNPLILALPRGGLPIGFEIAKKLVAPLDVIVVRKIGYPQNPEFGIGAVAEEGIVVWNLPVIARLGINPNFLLEQRQIQEAEILRRIKEYRDSKPLPKLNKYCIILVDDGLATGVTAKAAIKAVKRLNPQKIIFVSPVCSQKIAQELESLVDKVICLIKPEQVNSIGAWYKNFDQVTDEEVINLLKKSKKFSANLLTSNFQLGF